MIFGSYSQQLECVERRFAANALLAVLVTRTPKLFELARYVEPVI